MIQRTCECWLERTDRTTTSRSPYFAIKLSMNLERCRSLAMGRCACSRRRDCELTYRANSDLPTEIEAVAQLCIQHDYAPDLYDFYLLHDAYDSLRTSELQWYWPDAGRSNILQIMRQRAEEFVREEFDDSNG